MSVFLNHIYIILDEATYEAIKSSDFLKTEFCHCQENSNTGANDRGPIAWTGFYLIGENTYIELFNQKDQETLYSIITGNIGLGFSVDRIEELEKIYELFKQTFGNSVNKSLMEKTVNGINIPWFYSVEATIKYSMLPKFDTWIMAYHHDYCKKFNSNDITRKGYNQNYNAIPYDKTKLFKDIQEVTLLLTDDIKKKFVDRQTILGYTCEESDGNAICKGPEITLIVKPSKNQTCKLTALHMSLNRTINGIRTYNLGNSMLVLEHQTATWMFE
jgi:hypothetical protein